MTKFGRTTASEVAGHFGLSRAMVSYHLSLLRRLPPDFVEWLEGNEDPAVLSFFTERRLRPVCRIANTDEQVKRLREMMEEMDN